MPDLITIPDRISVFVDTNIFYYHFTGKSVTCTAFFNRIARGDFNAYVNTEVLSDLLHKLMLAEAGLKMNIDTAAKLKRYLSSHRTALTQLTEHQSQFESTLAMGLKVIRITKSLLINTQYERSAFGLLTNDSLHLGTMLRHRVPIAHVATRDGDFGHVHNLTVWVPQDVITGD